MSPLIPWWYHSSSFIKEAINHRQQFRGQCLFSTDPPPPAPSTRHLLHFCTPAFTSPHLKQRPPQIVLVFAKEPKQFNLNMTGRSSTALLQDYCWHSFCWNFIVFPIYISWSLSYISILSLGFGSTCYRLTLLQLEHVSWHFINYLGIIYGISLCVFLSGVRDFTVVMQGLLTYLCTLLGHNIFNYLLIIVSHHLRFTHIIWDFLGRISGSNTVRTFVSYYVSLYFYSYTWLSHACINMVATAHLA